MKHPDPETNIRYRPDGSIDTAYYMQIGRRKRAEQAQKMVKALAPKPAVTRRARWAILALRFQ